MIQHQLCYHCGTCVERVCCNLYEYIVRPFIHAVYILLRIHEHDIYNQNSVYTCTTFIGGATALLKLNDGATLKFFTDVHHLKT